MSVSLTVALSYAESTRFKEDIDYAKKLAKLYYEQHKLTSNTYAQVLLRLEEIEGDDYAE